MSHYDQLQTYLANLIDEIAHKSQIHLMKKTTHALKSAPVAESAPAFPRTRPRRNRRSEWMRRLVAEHQVTVDDLI